MDKEKSDAEWKKKLTPYEYHVLREKGTEPAFTGKYYKEHAKGMYRCRACGAELFSSDAKFDSGTGWPSFTEPANRENVELREDTGHGMTRTEVLCKQCGSHLGHVFDDLPETYRSGRAGGPKEKGGKRYCINSVCLDLKRDQHT
ncbi:MAG: peptide-methionine (R)-S-oxide reductase MsrB [Candidatus Liptonbacteria bacterium]|nr:peptide-methionine (R)-S-oxide reductase MsrB [Candidatus Liptonbacteria bacterium]